MEKVQDESPFKKNVIPVKLFSGFPRVLEGEILPVKSLLTDSGGRRGRERGRWREGVCFVVGRFQSARSR